MSYDIDDIPTVEGAAKLGRRADADSPVADAYIEERLATGNRLGSIALALGLESVEQLQNRAFPSGAQMAALQAVSSAAGGGPANYTMYTDCGPYNYNGTCNEPCFGFAPHHMDPFYCGTCAEQAADPVNNPSWNWHFVGSRGSIDYIDREPDVCAGKDAWKWDVGACGSCQDSAIYRCHDGYKIYSDGTCDPTICEGLVSCDGTLTTC